MVEVKIDSPNKEKSKAKSSAWLWWGATISLVVAVWSLSTVESPGNVPDASGRNGIRAAIPGLMPVDIYGNITTLGFSSVGPNTYGEEVGVDSFVHWVLTKENQNIAYKVEIFSNSGNDVYRIRLRSDAKIGLEGSVENLSKDFFGYIATIPHDGAQPDLAKTWVQENISSDLTEKVIRETVIAGLKYKIYRLHGSIELTMKSSALND